MSDSENFDKAEDEVLNKLIVGANRIGEQAAQYVRPSDDAIINFVVGIATEAEDQIVKAAMLQSRAFRREILMMATEYDELSIRPSKPQNSDLQFGAVPSFSEFKKKHRLGSVVSNITETTKSKTVAQTVRAIVPWAIAASMTLVAISQFISKTPGGSNYQLLLQPTMVHIVEKANFVRTNSRGSTEESVAQKVFNNSFDAAQSLLAQSVRYDRGDYSFTPQSDLDVAGVDNATIHLSFLDGKLTELGRAKIRIPQLSQSHSNDIELWVLGLPSRELLRSSIPSDTINLLWINHADSIACVVVTYPVDSGFVASNFVGLKMRY